MRSGWRGLVETLLPWYHPALERRRNARTERVVKRAEAARIRAERLIAEYRSAEELAHRSGERMARELERRR